MRALTLNNDNNFGRLGIRRNEESPIEGIDTWRNRRGRRDHFRRNEESPIEGIDTILNFVKLLIISVEMRKARLRALTQVSILLL